MILRRLFLLFILFSCSSYCFAENNIFRSSESVFLNHTFWINILAEESKLDYTIKSDELIKGQINDYEPNIIIAGVLVVKLANSAEKCRVKLPQDIIEATNEKGESVKIRLRGLIGNPQNYKKLTTDFVKPEFNEFNEARFIIEGYIEPSTYLSRLEPGKYNFLDNINLVVEFWD